MAHTKLDLTGFLHDTGGPTPDGLKKMLIYADTMEQFESDEAWAELCEFALKTDAAFDVTEDFTSGFMRGQSAARDMLDNYVLAALAACKIDWNTPEPLMAYAATNKHEFQGFAPHGLSEISCMRILHWGGWDINAALPETKRTALHLMAYLKYAPGSHPRAVRWLLESGADANARDVRGDTPLMLLSGCDPWLPEMTESFKLLLLAGADPVEKSAKGDSALSILTANQTKYPNPARAELIAALEHDMKRTSGFFTSMLTRKPEGKWEGTLAIGGDEPLSVATA